MPLRLRPGLQPLAAALLAAACTAAAARPAAADYVVGGVGNDNVFPFGSTNFYTGEYQQVYAATSFSGPAAVTGVGFQSVKLKAPGSVTLDVTLSLSTTAASLAAPHADFAANKGADFTTVFSGPITFSALYNGTYDLYFQFAGTPFAYDPSRGNLLLDVVINGSSGPGMASFLSGTTADVSRVYWSGGSPGTGLINLGVGEGLSTQFTTAAVPEPSGLVAFAVGGSVLAAAALRRRSRGS